MEEQKNGVTWESYAQVAGGLMGLTWGINRIRQGKGDWVAWTVTGVSAPLALNGLASWTQCPTCEDGQEGLTGAVPRLAKRALRTMLPKLAKRALPAVIEMMT